MEIMCHLTVLQIEGDDVIELSVAQRDVQLIFAGLNSIAVGCVPGAVGSV